MIITYLEELQWQQEPLALQEQHLQHQRLQLTRPTELVEHCELDILMP